MDFGDRIHVRKDLKSFKGDSDFVKDRETQKAFGRMRAAIAGAYAWRAANAKKENERQLMAEEADYAFRQAVAIGPASPDAVTRYAELLANKGRLADALRLAKFAVALDRSEDKLQTLLQTLRERSDTP